MRVIELKMLEVRHYFSKAQRLLQTSMSEINTSSSMGAFERMEAKLMQIEEKLETAKELEGINITEFFPSSGAEYSFDDELAIMKEQLIKGCLNSAEHVSNNIIDAELDELRAQLDN
jgi:phage shock protein A